MSTDVLMPQMGESVAEGTIVRWIKKVGDAVDRDEPLFEISTDKVDAEIPSPAAGVVAEIRAEEGETVPVNSVVAIIAPAGAQADGVPAKVERAERESVAPSTQPPPQAQPSTQMPRTQPPPTPPGGSPRSEAARTPVPASTISGERAGVRQRSTGVERQRSSPLVRKIAKEHHVDISKIQGTGIGGRVTRDDILAFLARPPAAAPSAVEEPDLTARPEMSGGALGAGLAGQTVQLSVMRRKIAEHMTASQRTSAHVHSVFEVNFAKVEQFRQARRAEFERGGARLTYLAFIVSAVAQGLRDAPVLNASVQDDKIVYHEAINIGIAVALDWGLIVPVVRDAAGKDLLSLSLAIADLAARARAKQLKADEVAGGTFTVTNPGALGALLGTPIINQPQVAILGVGAIEKRPVVIHDAIAIRPVGHLTLGFDHRIIDGAVADTFMARVKRKLENWHT